MSKTTGTLAALLLMTSALASTAEAGDGVRLSFGGPLGSFVAHPKLSSGPGGTARASRHCDKPSVARAYSRPKSYAVAARKAHKAPTVDVAEASAHKAPRKPKVYLEKKEKTPSVQTAKLEDKSVVSDAAPSITVPESPVAPAVVTGTQSSAAAQGAGSSTTSNPASSPATPAPATTQTAALEQSPVTVPAVAPDAELKASTTANEPAAQAAVTPAVSVTTPTTAEAATSEPETSEAAASETKPGKGKAKADSMANRICKRFSAAIAGLIDVPCE